MKKPLLIIICTLLLFACTKSTTPGTTTVYTTGESDTFTLTDNGITYSDISEVNSNVANCELHKTAVCSYFSFYLNINVSGSGTDSIPVQFEIINIPGPLNGIGTYKIVPIDSSFSMTFRELFSGNTDYFVDSCIVNLSFAGISTIRGTFQLWVNNYLSVNKEVTGTFNFHNANIE